MEDIISFLKSFFVLTLILAIFSYLVPKKEYQKYIQFFIGIVLAVIILEPVGDILFNHNTAGTYESLEQLTDQLEQIHYDKENGEDLFELFYFDTEN